MSAGKYFVSAAKARHRLHSVNQLQPTVALGEKDRDDNVRQHHWILSVLDDLETYATLNDLPLIKDRIAVAKTTAKEEMILKSVQAADEQSGLRGGTVVPLHVYGTR